MKINQNGKINQKVMENRRILRNGVPTGILAVGFGVIGGTIGAIKGLGVASIGTATAGAAMGAVVGATIELADRQ